jgi:cytochrome c
MRKLFITALCIAALGAGVGAQASEALAEKNACLNCHGISKKIVGPAFSAIAEKYKDRKDSAAYLTEKIAKGSTGVWGQVPMPGMPQLAPDEVKTMVTWIMALPAKK